MTLQLDDKWIWDSWYAHDGEKWHGYFLQADNSLGDPEMRHFHVSQGHATSADLVNWTYLGTCFEPSPEKTWDDYTVWTGSVTRDDDGLWHLFYTGGSRGEKGLYQRIGHATSRDMHSWERVGDGLCLDLTGPAAEHYETRHQIDHWHDRAMRDPWVMRDPEGDGWLMYFTARAPGIEEPNAGGAIGLATSDDLNHWILQPPVFVGGYGQLEVPQVIEIGGLWYCLFCTHTWHWSEKEIARNGPALSGNHYLVSESPRGPFRLPEAPFFDGAKPCERYCGRLLKTDGGLRLMGFLDRGRDDFAGVLMDPVPVYQDKNGNLTFEAPVGAEGK